MTQMKMQDLRARAVIAGETKPSPSYEVGVASQTTLAMPPSVSPETVQPFQAPSSSYAWNLWRQWTLYMAFGEWIGFAVPSLVGGLAALFGVSQVGMFALMLVAGWAEGAILGFAQWLVLQRHGVFVRVRDWVWATGIAASLAWAIGMLPSTIEDFSRWDPRLVAFMAIVLGLCFVMTIGAAQWFVLRRHVQQAWGWIIANAVAWPLGVAIPFITLSVMPDDTHLALMIVIGIMSGILMGLTVGAITGVMLVQLLRKPITNLQISPVEAKHG